MDEVLDRYTRVRWLFGDKFEDLVSAKVLICGAGGVGGMCADALARTGIGKIVLVDKDTFDITNQNRQIHSELTGAIKVDEFAKKYNNIIPVKAVINNEFLNNIDLNEFDVIIDAIDDMGAKVSLALKSPKDKFIASMGGAKRIDATKIKTASVWKTYGDPFARKYRLLLKKAGYKGNFPVVFSTEEPNCKVLGSFMGVTAIFGLNLASMAVKKILQK